MYAFRKGRHLEEVSLESLGGPCCRNIAPRETQEASKIRKQTVKNLLSLLTRSWKASVTQHVSKNGPKLVQNLPK